MSKFIIKKIESLTTPPNQELVQRLYDLGLHPGLEVDLISTVSFGTIKIVEYNGTRLALNQEEYACLLGH
jgi:Fe2+ transport system protein FeoA